MKVESVPIGSIHLDPANARRHPERNLASIKASLAAYGQQKPIVVNPRGVVIAGNGTLEAARAMGWDKIAVVRSGLEGTQAVAFAIADNRTAELAEWDEVGLAEQLRALQSEDIDLAAVGYDAGEVDAMLDRLAGEVIDNSALADAMGGLPDGDKSPFQQMTFTVSDGQAETVKAALDAAKDAGPFVNSGNENSNGNALARIAETYLGRG